MEQPAAKRPSNFSDTSFLPKRPKIGDDYPNSPHSPTFSDGSDFGGRRPSVDDSRPKQHVLSSAEVAADFKDSLQDLAMNNRYEISNLTVIARESTEHAMAISRVLENHIRTAPPARKLPAIYVLDSIVKNVGTPYTIYLGQNLYRTFMDAYTLVDNQTRKALDAVLKTWKEPMPGSNETRPVFPVDITRPIDNALIKARTAFVQQQQQQQRSQKQFQPLPPRPPVPGQQAWRNTPTPPYTDQRYAPPPQPELLRYDMPQYEQLRYGTPADLQYGNTPLNSFPSSQSPPLANQASQYATQPVQTHPPPPALPYQNGPSLAELLQGSGSFSNLQQQQPPQPPQLNPPPNAVAESNHPVNLFPGLGALFQNPAAWTQPAPAKIATPPPTQSAISTPPIVPAGLVRSPLTEVQNDVKLTTASLKVQRPELLSVLYEAQPSQCRTCGRRFPATEAGKARKGRHLDWHFRTNMRITEASKAGVTRSWYVDEMDWIKHREVDEADAAPAAGPTTAAGAGADEAGTTGYGQSTESKKRERYVKAPADAALAHHACPICQEEFTTVWHDSAQEWVWMDAVDVGGRVFHASCIEELQKDRGTPVPAQQQTTTRSKADASGGGVKHEAYS